jgi:hypothetical protein
LVASGCGPSLNWTFHGPCSVSRGPERFFGSADTASNKPRARCAASAYLRCLCPGPCDDLLLSGKLQENVTFTWPASDEPRVPGLAFLDYLLHSEGFFSTPGPSLPSSSASVPALAPQTAPRYEFHHRDLEIAMRLASIMAGLEWAVASCCSGKPSSSGRRVKMASMPVA